MKDKLKGEGNLSGAERVRGFYPPQDFMRPHEIVRVDLDKVSSPEISHCSYCNNDIMGGNLGLSIHYKKCKLII